MTRGEDLQSYQISAAARAPDNEQLWIGTRGNGLFYMDPRFGNATHLPFGLLSPGAGALALAADGVWIAGLGGDPLGRDGLTFARADLQRWRWVQGGNLRPLRDARALDLAVRGDIAWVATTRGLVRINLENESDSRRWSATNGLPDDIALSVAATARGVWVGTRRGLVFLPDTSSRMSAGRGDVGATIASGIPVRSLAAMGDTLWAGTDAGLIAVVAGDSAARRPSSPDGRLRQRIVAVARTDSVVLVANERVVMLLAPSGALTTPINSAIAAPLQQITAIAADEKTIWVAGLGGVLVMLRESGVTRFLPVANDIPAEALDVLLEPDFAWIATRDGLLRLRRMADGTVR
jgi:ligand-binding sensor domain-containing protein